MSVNVVRHFGTFVFSTLDQFLAFGCFEKLRKMQHHVSSFIDRCINLYLPRWISRYIGAPMDSPTPIVHQWYGSNWWTLNKHARYSFWVASLLQFVFFKSQKPAVLHLFSMMGISKPSFITNNGKLSECHLFTIIKRVHKNAHCAECSIK